MFFLNVMIFLILENIQAEDSLSQACGLSIQNFLLMVEFV